MSAKSGISQHDENCKQNFIFSWRNLSLHAYKYKEYEIGRSFLFITLVFSHVKNEKVKYKCEYNRKED